MFGIEACAVGSRVYFELTSQTEISTIRETKRRDRGERRKTLRREK